MTEAVLTFSHVHKEFNHNVVLEDVNLAIRAGTVHALCGGNGCGKSTLMKILAGVHQPTSGEMQLNGQPYKPKNPKMAIKAGVSMIYQELSLIESLSVTENIFLGHEITRRSGLFKNGGLLDNAAMREQVHSLIKKLRFTINPDELVSNLTAGDAQRVEILKAIHTNARILVFDEPTTALSESDTEKLFTLIRELKARGIAIIYISHRLQEIEQIADEVSVLRDGKIVLTGKVGDITIDQIVTHMIGRTLENYYPPHVAKKGKARLVLKNLVGKKSPEPINLTLYAGEITGLAGLVGAGRSHLIKLLAGIEPIKAGEIVLDGKTLSLKKPADAIDANIFYLSENRKKTGLCVNLPISWNTTLSNLQRLGMSFKIDLQKEDELCRLNIDKVQTKVVSIEDAAGTLSGGNQQKLLLARALMVQNDVFLFDEPTKGIDIEAKLTFYELLQKLAAAGKVILIAASETAELLGITDRLLVMRERKIVADMLTSKATTDLIMRYATLENEKEELP